MVHDLQDSVAPEKALICEKRKEDVVGSAGMISMNTQLGWYLMLAACKVRSASRQSAGQRLAKNPSSHSE